MKLFRTIWRWLRSLGQRRAVKQEIDEELRFHIEQRTAENIAAGMSSEEAAREARRRFGNVQRVREECRDVRGANFGETMLQDIRFGLRMLLKNPGFTAVAVFTLALGIGSNTVIFGLLDKLLLHPLPYPESEGLVRVWRISPNENRSPISPVDFLAFQRQNQTLEQLAAFAYSTFTLTGDAVPERIEGVRVSANFFPMLALRPAAGRFFLPDEDGQGHDQVVILSHGFWQRQFGSNSNLVGQSITLDGQKFTVVGIMSPHSELSLLLGKVDLWKPMAFDDSEVSNRDGNFLEVFGRLKPGVGRQSANIDLDTIERRLEAQYPESHKGRGMNLVLLNQTVNGEGGAQLLIILMGTVAFVLLIACANVANLQLARCAARSKEMAIRTALGAGRLRVIRQLLTENVTLAVVGGIGGVLVASWGNNLLAANIHLAEGITLNIGLNGRVLAFTCVISLLTGIIFGVAPALQGAQADLNKSLKERGGSGSGTFRRHRFRRLLVVSQVALALVLLIGVGLFIQSIWRSQLVNKGFNPNHVLTLEISLPKPRYPQGSQQADFFRKALERIAGLPGVELAGAGTSIPVSGSTARRNFIIEGQSAPAPGAEPEANFDIVSPNYFRALQIPLRQGRYFTEQDTGDAPGVLLINATMAHRNWPDENPIGKRVIFGKRGEEKRLTIVGVVGDIKFPVNITHPEARPTMYLSYLQEPRISMMLLVRTSTDPASLASAIRNEVAAVDKDQPVSNIMALDQALSDAVRNNLVAAFLLGLFAVVGLVLAAVGIYGVTAYSVSQRTHEIGVRMALGAQRADVLKLVLGQGMGLALIGIVTGFLGSLALTHVMSSLLYEVKATDPITFGGVTLFLLVVALTACYFPARRAAKVDPMVALGYE